MQWTEWLAGFAGASPIEWIATVSGFLCVFLIIKRSIWCFFFGFIQVSLYSYIFYDVKLYSDMLLHLIYVGFQVYGYWIWSKNLDDGGHVVVHRGSNNLYVQISVLAIIATVLWGWFMASNTDASLPYFDAFTTCVSLIAQWLMSHKKLYNWSFWIVVDVVAIWVYWQKALYPTSVLYLCFLVMACIGQYQWWRIYHKNSKQFA
ncbi:nicotinamide riboside transporter PnuC [Aliiglaciecola sp. 3_MG-2023]|uniref:nicotinamide riboside transporter PnuC n=1 Tax=Aliiglaciecola sp. 3_MG-2023 TaxID=3062644 RepID=UPI0026E28110|nr:nicotinamide riboside transporter PnuC [Aliiglaciecola sp. 3_MG-2023]MDO6692821.1 nicotinamide riboside transporter PnuC [Aliiglaciecola sp. 3_MG-2023]